MRPARVVVSQLSMAAVKDPYKTLGRRQEGLAGRDQEGLPQARAPVPPGQEPRRRAAPRSASRRSSGPTTILGDPEKRKQYDQRRRHLRRRLRSGRRSAPARSGRRLRRLRRHPLRPLRRRRAAAARGRPAAPERGRDLETEVHISFEQAMEGAPGAGDGAGARDLPDLPRHRRQAGHHARPSARAARAAASSRRAQGLFSISQPCSQCGGTGTEIKDPCPTCHGRGQTRAGQALPREHPGGRARRQPRAAGRQGRGRVARRAARRPLRDHARGRRRRCSSARATTSRWRCRSRSPRRSAAPTSRCRRCTARKRIRVAPGTQHGTVQRLRGEGPPKLERQGPRRHPLPPA